MWSMSQCACFTQLTLSKNIMIKQAHLRFIYFCCFSLVSTSALSFEQDNEKSLINTLTTNVVKISAHITIFSAEIIASKAAEKELKKFRVGEHNGEPTVYLETSSETKELFAGRYYKQLNLHLMKELVDWYDGKIPLDGGLFSQSNTFRVFGAGDFIWEISDGIDLADIIGSITYYVSASTRNGIIYFQGVNKMSLQSYSGQNYLRHGLVINPQAGSFKSTSQVFKWQVEIPVEFRK
jgi:hypothetical protein